MVRDVLPVVVAVWVLENVSIRGRDVIFQGVTYAVGVKVLVYEVTVPYLKILLQYAEPIAGAPRIHLKT